MFENLIAVVGLHSVVWLVSLVRRDVSIVDLFWGVGFAVIAWRSTLSTDSNGSLTWLLVVLVTLWAVRLSAYLTWRNWGQPEDRRYRAMRDSWGSRFPLVSYFTVFLLQAVLTWIVALPLQLGAMSDSEIGWIALIGTTIWAVGLTFETVGDLQLARFKADPENQGKVMDRGLWAWTRHPNYFGDFLVWWGIYLISLQAGFVWWGLVGPIVMSILLMKVSGVTLLEKSLNKRVDGYAEYASRTNAFFPALPRK